MKKLILVMVTFGTAITLASCGNQAGQVNVKSDQATVAKESSSMKQDVNHTGVSLLSDEAAKSSNVAMTNSQASSAIVDSKDNQMKQISSVPDSKRITFTEQNARDMLIAHLGNQANNEHQDASVTTTQTNAVAGL